MRKRLQLALMLTATTAITTSFSLMTPAVWAAEGDGRTQGITTSDENGRKIYVNEEDSPMRGAAVASRAAEAFGLGVLEYERESLEAGAFGEYGLDAGRTIGGGRDQPVFWA